MEYYKDTGTDSCLRSLFKARAVSSLRYVIDALSSYVSICFYPRVQIFRKAIGSWNFSGDMPAGG